MFLLKKYPYNFIKPTHFSFLNMYLHKNHSWIHGFVIFRRNLIFNKNHVLESCFKSHFEIIFWDHENDFLCKNCSHMRVTCTVSSLSCDLSILICRKWSQMLIFYRQNLVFKMWFQNMIPIAKRDSFLEVQFCLNHGASSHYRKPSFYSV